MEYDFALNWTLEDARFIARKEYAQVEADETNEKAINNLRKVGEMYTKSLGVLNTHCMEELKAYRKSIVSRQPWESQAYFLSVLHKAYLKKM